jgi:hypothetical protein
MSTLAAPMTSAQPSMSKPTRKPSAFQHAPARTPIAVAHGDGTGPEVMDATLSVLGALGAGLEYRPIDIGRKVYEKGITAGIEPAS